MKPPRATPTAPGGSDGIGHMKVELTLGDVIFTIEGPPKQVKAYLDRIMTGGGTPEAVIGALKLVAGPQKA
jgi:hypothetical protein